MWWEAEKSGIRRMVPTICVKEAVYLYGKALVLSSSFSILNFVFFCFLYPMNLSVKY